MEKHVKQIVVAMATAFLIGGIEMRATLARLEATVAAVDKRVERIEHELDGQRTYATKE